MTTHTHPLETAMLSLITYRVIETLGALAYVINI